MWQARESFPVIAPLANIRLQFGTPNLVRFHGRTDNDCSAANTMNEPILYLVRHGETTWSVSGQHTGLTDLPLTDHGRTNAGRLGVRLKALTLAKVFTSPLQRAIQTCEIAGFKEQAETDPDLVEWNYGKYEGRTTAEIRAERPDWQLFRDGCPGGESPSQVGARADNALKRVR